LGWKDTPQDYLGNPGILSVQGSGYLGDPETILVIPGYQGSGYLGVVGHSWEYGPRILIGTVKMILIVYN